MRKSGKKSAFIFLCLMPAVVLFIVFMIIPILDIFRMSLYKWGGYTSEKTFVGLSNFETLFSNTKFYQSMQNSLFLIVTVTVASFILAMIFAGILSNRRTKAKEFFKAVFYLPSVLSIVAVAAIFSAVYSPKTGLLNNLIAVFDGKSSDFPILWLGERQLVIYSIGAAMVWQAAGYYMFIYLSAIEKISDSFYESAALDGAGKMRQFFSVTIPLIWDSIRTTLAFFVISNVNISFLLVKIMTNGGPNGASGVFLSYMYQEAYTNSSYGYGMAIGVTVFFISFILTALANLATRRETVRF